MAAERMAIAWPNWLLADPNFATVDITDGGWDPATPISRLLVPRLSAGSVARSVDVSTGSTMFWVDLGQIRRLKVLAFPWIRGLTSSGLISGYVNLTVRARVFSAKSTSSTLLYDSEAIDQHPVIYNRATLPSSHPSFLNGKVTPEEASAFDWKQPWWHWIDAEVLGRYVLFEINASGSSLEVLELPYLVVAPGYQPLINMLFGAAIAVEPLTRVVETESGAELFDVRPDRRVSYFTLDESEDETMSQILDMMTRMSIHNPVFFMHSTADTVHKQRRAYLGRLRRLGRTEFVNFGRLSTAFEISEVLE